MQASLQLQKIKMWRTLILATLAGAAADGAAKPAFLQACEDAGDAGCAAKLAKAAAGDDVATVAAALAGARRADQGAEAEEEQGGLDASSVAAAAAAAARG